MIQFDYQKKVWGGSTIRLSPTYLAYLRLKYCLADLSSVSGKILDAGCGGGGFAEAIKYYRPDLDIYGIDLSKKAIKYAGKKFPKIHFSVSSLYNLSFSDDFFDAIVIADVLEHLDEPDIALKEIFRVLRPGGVFHAFIPLEGEVVSLHYWFERFGWRAKECKAGHIQKYRYAFLKEHLHELGFQVMRRRYSGHLFGQIIDVSYFSLLEITGRELGIGLEQELEGRSVLASLKNLIAYMVNVESSFFPFFPASGVHILCQKRVS